MAINLSANEIVFLYKTMVDNATLVKVKELTGLTKDVKVQYNDIYQKHIASHKEIDWNCASCAVDAVTIIYRDTAPFADKIDEAIAELKASEPKASKAK
jgi:hypothetical protein